MLSVSDGDREIRFEGVLLGESSSHRSGKDRWIEISIHKTNGGKYVVAGTGCTSVEGETERHWAHVSETPQGCLESLHLYDNDGVRYLTRTAKVALAQACALDEKLRDSYMIQTID
jgi:hypothetical protein